MQTSNGPLYFRSRNYADLRSYLHDQEEVLNHLFDLTFAIAGDDVINRVLCEPLGLDDAGPFASIGREVGQRYGWRTHENVTQQDGFFVSKTSLIGVELKLESSSWPEQIAKYLALMTWEQQRSGPREHLALLFVVPANAVTAHWDKLGLAGPHLDQGFTDRLDRQRLPARIRGLFENQPEALVTSAGRLRLAVMSWERLRSDLASYVKRLDTSQPGDQTLDRLIAGLCDQIDLHGKTKMVGGGELIAAANGTDRDLHEGVLAAGDEALAMSIGRDQAERIGLSTKELSELFDRETDSEAEEGESR